MGSLKAVILAAGEGIRLRPFTTSRPKGMIPVGNKPVLEHIIKALTANGIRDIIIVVGYCENTIRSYFGDGRRFAANISYVSQLRPLGTAHALSCAWDLIKDENQLLVLAGDNCIDCKTVASALQGKAPSMVVTESKTPSKYGAISTRDGKVTAIVEKPQTNFSNIISTGIYIFDKNILNLFDPDRISSRGISETLSTHLEDLQAIKTQGAWIDAVFPQDILGLNETALEHISDKISGTVEKGAVLKGPIIIGEGSRIRAGCYLEGPIVIGENCDIGPNAVIMPATSIGNDVQVGPFTYVADCVFMDNITISAHCHLVHSVVDCGVVISSNVSVSMPYGYKSPGVMIGQDGHIDSQVVFMPGVVIGSECRIGSGAVVRTNLENRSIVV